MSSLPVWLQALTGAAPWCVLVLLIGAMHPCWPWWHIKDEDEP